MDDIIKGIYTKDQEVSFGVQMPIEIKEDESSYVDAIDSILNENLEGLSVIEKMIATQNYIEKVAVVVNDANKALTKTEDNLIDETTSLYEYSQKVSELIELYQAEILSLDETIEDKEQIIYEQQEIINNN